jgi:hypothetical protein
MSNDKNSNSAFSNRRDWGSYLTALQTAATYPNLKDAVKSGREWFTESAAQASSWLAGSVPLKDKFSTG